MRDRAPPRIVVGKYKTALGQGSVIYRLPRVIGRRPIDIHISLLAALRLTREQKRGNAPLTLSTILASSSLPLSSFRTRGYLVPTRSTRSLIRFFHLESGLTCLEFQRRGKLPYFACRLKSAPHTRQYFMRQVHSN